MIPKNVFMVGIGGIGMSALAQLLIDRGIVVRGSDRSVSPVTELLEKKGVQVFPHGKLPTGVELLIYSDAIPADNPERLDAHVQGIAQLSYFEALGEVSRSMRTIAVAGTHGKTTTTGMLAHALIKANVQPTVIVGSIIKDFGSNYVAGRDDLLVVEACEYRDHLLKLSPEVLVVTNIEWDHTDYFSSLEVMQQTFESACARVPSHGAIVTNPHDACIAPAIRNSTARIVDYTQETVPPLHLIGTFNRENAQAAKAAAIAAFPDIDQSLTGDALASFQGSWRRFEYKGVMITGAELYDDYAHHPTAIEKTIAAARERFPQKRIIVVFHPHLYSRTRDLFDGFVRALATADSVILAPIYAAREKDPGTVSSDLLAEHIAAYNPRTKSLQSFDEIISLLQSETTSDDVVITMGAGDIYTIADKLIQ